MNLERVSHPKKWHRAPAEERIWRYVEIPPEGGCWTWIGAQCSAVIPASRRYGRFTPGRHYGYGTHGVGAHKAMFMLAVGPVPSGLMVCHRCDNRLCVNPCHLFLGTQRDNVLDMNAKGRRNDPIGNRNKSTRLNEEKVRSIRARKAAGWTQRGLAEEFGVTQNAIFCVVHRITWAHVA